MKKLIYFLAALGVIAALIIYFPQKTKDIVPDITENVTNVLGNTSTLSAEVETVTAGGPTYEVALVSVPQDARITYHSNLADHETSKGLFNELACRALINGGFYSKENTHLGLRISENETITRSVESTLFNGYFTINDFETPRITQNLPKDNLRVAIQSGPLLVENANSLTLSMTRDEHARRSVIATTGTNEVILMSFYSPTSKFIGPLLSELPGLVAQVDKTHEEFVIADAINLDGGSASALLTEDFSLTEASTLGGVICAH